MSPASSDSGATTFSSASNISGGDPISEFYLHEEQPMGGGGAAGLGAVARGEHGVDAVRGTPSVADVDEGADDAADHVAEEAVPLDLDEDFAVRLLEDVHARQRADGAADVRAAPLQRREVVRAHKASRGIAHGLEVELIRHVPSEAAMERQLHG